jgi:hypothetical protein
MTAPPQKTASLVPEHQKLLPGVDDSTVRSWTLQCAHFSAIEGS